MPTDAYYRYVPSASDFLEKNKGKLHGKILNLASLVFLMSASGAAVSFAVDFAIAQLRPLAAGPASPALGLPTFAHVLVSILLLWGARFVVELEPMAVGSGLPQIKCMLSDWAGPPNFLSWRVGAGKAAGLALAVASGQPLGKEGPFVHIAACFGIGLLHTKCFEELRAAHIRELVLLAAISVGVGVTFSAPVGGLIFAMELMMPRVYDNEVKRLSFFSSTTGSLAFLVLKMLITNSGVVPLLSDDIDPASMDFMDTSAAAASFIGASLLLGVICGLLASAYVEFDNLTHKGFERARRFLEGQPSLRQDMLLLALIVVAEQILVAEGDPLIAMPPPAIMSTKLFKSGPISAEPVRLLFKVLVARWLLCALALSLPVPSGCVAPLLAIGALIGRLYSEVLFGVVCPSLGCDPEVQGGLGAVFAIIGAGCFTGAVCHTLSIVVTIFELIPLPRMTILPLALSQFVAVTTAKHVVGTKSIFDMALVRKAKDIPALPTLIATNKAMETVDSHLDSDLLPRYRLPRFCQRKDLFRVWDSLRRCEVTDSLLPKMLPIVEEVPGLPRDLLIGAVLSKDLQEVMYDSSWGGDEDAAKDLVKAVGPRLAKPHTVASGTTLRDAHIHAQITRDYSTMLVVEGGFLVGILMPEDLLPVS